MARLLLGVLVCSGARGLAAVDPVPAPLPWQEPSPFSRLFLQLPFDVPSVVPEGALTTELRLLYSNALLSARNASFTLFVHVETAQTTALLRFGLAAGLEAQLALPGYLDYGGFLDGPIDRVEGALGAANPQRRGLERNTAIFQLTRPDGTGLLRKGTDAGLGDAWIGLKASLPNTWAGGRVALRWALKLPTGRLPFGSEDVDLGMGVLAAWTWASTALRLELDALLPTGAVPQVHVRTGAYGALHLGVTQALGRDVALQLQVAGHLSPLEGTGLDQLDSGQAYVMPGVSLQLSRGLQLSAGVSENVWNPYRGADITFLLAIASVP